jgi:hypothetical protein
MLESCSRSSIFFAQSNSKTQSFDVDNNLVLDRAILVRETDILSLKGKGIQSLYSDRLKRAAH